MADNEPKARSGCGGLLVAMLVFAVIGGGAVALLSSGKSKTPQQNAAAYISKLGVEANLIAANIGVVEINVGPHADINRLAQAAQQAHDNLNADRNDFATIPDSGNLGTAETEVFTAANDLKNAMGALVAYTGTPNPATLAQFTTQYQTAKGEWNDGVNTIWGVAGRKGAPTI